MNISDAVILAVLTILSGAVAKLWADNRKLSAQVAKLSEILGKYVGLKTSVRACPVRGCVLRDLVAARLDDGHVYSEPGVDSP